MPKTGKSATVFTAVSDKNTAKAVGSGSLDVFSTPMMIALMEQAACECLNDSLESGQTSVGTKINIEHLAASPLGATISASAVIESTEGRRIEFSVTADCGDIQIGKGTHSRVIVDSKRFMERL
jgi:predicted thioesterase